MSLPSAPSSEDSAKTIDAMACNLIASSRSHMERLRSFGSFKHACAEEDLRSSFAKAQEKIEQQVSELDEKTEVYFSPNTSDAERLHLAPELDEECECIAGQLAMLHNQATGAAARAPLRVAGQLSGQALLGRDAPAAATPGQDLAQQRIWLDLTRSRVLMLKESLKVTTYSQIQQLQRSAAKLRGPGSGGGAAGGLGEQPGAQRGPGAGGAGGLGEQAGAQERSGLGGAVKGYVADLDRTLSGLKHKLMAGFKPSPAAAQPVVQ